MEKTLEQKRSAVLAECERLWDELSPERFKPYPSYPDISRFVADGVTESYTVWPFGDDSAYCMVIYVGRDIGHDQWLEAYHILGLDARAEREKAKGLVEAMELIRNEKLAGDRGVLERIHGHCDKALATYEKGVSNV